MEICFLDGHYKNFLPFLNAVLIPPRRDTMNPNILHSTKSKYPFIKELMVKWDQRFPSVSTYMLFPCRGYKMIDIDINDNTYCDEKQLEFFNGFVSLLNNCNKSNSVINRDDLKECYGRIRDIGDKIYDILSLKLEFNKEHLYYTGRGFQIWAPYDYDVIKPLMDNGYICDSNDEERKAQRLFSPLFMGIEKENKAHMQCCVPYNDWNRFKYSNPAYFKILNKETRDAAMEYNKALTVSSIRTGDKDYLKWFDKMQRRQVELEARIYKLLGVDITPILT